MSRGIHGGMDEWDAQSEGWVEECLEGCLDEWVNGWMDGCMYGGLNV